MFSVILLMAGKGNRMNIDINKTLLPLGDKLVYEHSLDKFLSFNDEIICVISKDDEDKLKLPKNVKVVYGGLTRGESVKNGLEAASNPYIIIHDAARPFISLDIINQIKKLANKEEAILTYLDVNDTIKLNDGKIKTLERNKLLRAVTPQCGPRDILLKAYNNAFNDKIEFTDDISLLEYYYPQININLIKANDHSFKITTKVDYELAQIVWRKYYA
ncbi:MAG: 2-C-methyl-D-erythritol 4-phosphate cytidylyltransferase [Acholeplasmatales bacterium]|nr:2-C-methyl-D-erythritol 4-phosphate cytidylyltransferase [Acholeplasmatales bacterium]